MSVGLRWRRDENLAIVDTGDRVVLLHLGRLKDGGPLVLTGSAAEIWRAIDGESDTEGIVARVAAKFSVAASEIRDQVQAFLAQLAERGLTVCA